MGPLRSGPRGGTGPWGQYKTPDMLGSIRAQRGRARSALFHRVNSIFQCLNLFQSIRRKFVFAKYAVGFPAFFPDKSGIHHAINIGQ